MPSTQPDDRTAVPRAQSLAALWADMQPHALRTGLPGVPSGMPALDRLTGGWRPGTLTVVAGRPGMGITSFLLTALRNAAVDYGIPVLYCAPAEQISYAVRRLMLGEGEVDATDLYTTSLSGFERYLLPERLAPLLSASFQVLAAPAPDCQAVRRAAQASESAPSLVVFDYPLSLYPKAGCAPALARKLLGELRDLAKALAAPVLLAGTVLAASDIYGGDCRPRFNHVPYADLLPSYADLILLLYRFAYYYGIDQDTDGLPAANEAEVQVAYNRYGPSKSWLKLHFADAYGRFSSAE